jgi:AcrR family transcriptional regulator
MSDSTGRHRADEVLLLGLAVGETVATVAQQAGVSEATVYRRLGEPEFADRLQEIRTEMVRRATALLTAAAAQAVQTLRDLQAEDVSPTVRLGAAKAALELGSKLRTEGELTVRLEAAERALGLRP